MHAPHRTYGYADDKPAVKVGAGGVDTAVAEPSDAGGGKELESGENEKFMIATIVTATVGLALHPKPSTLNPKP